jgi:hypothetical protein
MQLEHKISIGAHSFKRKTKEGRQRPTQCLESRITGFYQSQTAASNKNG